LTPVSVPAAHTAGAIEAINEGTGYVSTYFGQVHAQDLRSLYRRLTCQLGEKNYKVRLRLVPGRNSPETPDLIAIEVEETTLAVQRFCFVVFELPPSYNADKSLRLVREVLTAVSISRGWSLDDASDDYIRPEFRGSVNRIPFAAVSTLSQTLLFVAPPYALEAELIPPDLFRPSLEGNPRAPKWHLPVWEDPSFVLTANNVRKLIVELQATK
jgi:hypothetical protein